jgi:ABC-type glycerol-3-phosphate transport system substrate-binding protein
MYVALSIPQGARNPEGAAAFMNFAIQSEQIERVALGQGKISPLRRQSEYYIHISSHRNPHLQDLQKILLSAELFYDPRVPQWMSLLGQIKQAFLSIWSGLATPPEALNAINRAS